MVETHPEQRLLAYARVSTYGQTLDSQLEQLRAAGCATRNIYREKVTGAQADRRELNRMLGKLAPGDVVTVTRIDRQGRSRAKAQGKSMGRPPSLTPAQQKEAIKRRGQGAKLDELARSYNVSRATISRLQK